jgi:NO-binding membrane sensor protein with MHYT domain
MLSSDLSHPFNRAVFVFIGLMIVGFGVASMWHVGFVYHNWRKDIVFGPFAILIGLAFIALMFKLGSLERKEKAMRRHRGR